MQTAIPFASFLLSLCAAVSCREEARVRVHGSETIPIETLGAAELEGPPAGVPSGYTAGGGLSIENLTVWPLYGETKRGVERHVPFHGAVASGLVEIRELRAGASVNELEILNDADDPVLILAGTVVFGGKQDRQIARDTVVPARSDDRLPAFCVERNRWNPNRSGRDTKGIFEVADVLASKRVRASGAYSSQQGEVWKQVGVVNRKAGKAPSTGTFLAFASDLSETERALREAMAGAVLARFEDFEEDEPLGIGYAINGEPIAARVFADTATFRAHLRLLVRTMVAEAEVSGRGKRMSARESAENARTSHLVAMIETIGEARPRLAWDGDHHRLYVGQNRRGGGSVCQVPVRDKWGTEWRSITRDWTGAVQLERSYVRELQMEDALAELGYTESD